MPFMLLEYTENTKDTRHLLKERKAAAAGGTVPSSKTARDDKQSGQTLGRTKLRRARREGIASANVYAFGKGIMLLCCMC